METNGTVNALLLLSGAVVKVYDDVVDNQLHVTIPIILYLQVSMVVLYIVLVSQNVIMCIPFGLSAIAMLITDVLLCKPGDPRNIDNRFFQCFSVAVVAVFFVVCITKLNEIRPYLITSLFGLLALGAIMALDMKIMPEEYSVKKAVFRFVCILVLLIIVLNYGDVQALKLAQPLFWVGIGYFTTWFVTHTGSMCNKHLTGQST